MFSDTLLISSVIICAVFCLCPLFSLNNTNYYSLCNLDRIISPGDTESSHLLISLSIVIIPAADLLADFMTYFFMEKKLFKMRESNILYRLTDIERLIFIVGVAIESTIFFLPTEISQSSLYLVHSSIDNASILLILSPIIICLGRCCITFTPARTFTIISCAVAGMTLRTISSIADEKVVRCDMISVGSSVICLGAVLYLACLAICLSKCFMKNLGTSSSRRFLQKRLMQFWQRTGDHCKVNSNLDLFDDTVLYSNCIPAILIMSSIAILVPRVLLTAPAIFYIPHAGAYLKYIILCAEIVVLVVELRIRKSETARGLAALLQSKQSYVRYISHELRTPLNTAFLGLKLLTNELKASDDTRDAARYDTLCDVNMSCTAAVSILNDLLCYEKLESGKMELHKETVTVEPFLKNCLSLFAAQSNECGVTITLDVEASTDVSQPSHASTQDMSTEGSPNMNVRTLSIQPHDAIHIDRFKMDQVVRNLLSNALKFTPRGGSVTVKASFVHTHAETSDPPVRGGCSSGESTDSNPEVFARPVPHPATVRYCSAENCIPYRLRRDSTTPRVPGSTAAPTPECIVGKLVLVVIDTGAGINKENQKRLFKEIVQFSPEKLQSGGGSGLGLWITAGILDLHDGDIRVHSEGEGSGSTFIAELPMIRYPAVSLLRGTPVEHMCLFDEIPESAHHSLEELDFFTETIDRSMVYDKSMTRQPSASTFNDYSDSQYSSREEVIIALNGHNQSDNIGGVEGGVEGGAGGGGGGGGGGADNKIRAFDLLVVDDSRLNRKMLLKCLKANGHTCWEAEDGVEAVAAVEKRMRDRLLEPFDAILMDFVMPNMDGPEATQKIRALGYKGLIFGVTGNGLSTDVEHFEQCGANKVLLKPLDLDDFESSMRELCMANIYGTLKLVLS